MNATLRERYREDGVVHVPDALCAETMKLAEAAYDWSLANPGPGASRIPSKGREGTFYQDLANPRAFDAYHTLIFETEVGDVVASLFGSEAVWFMYEQVFLKENGRTPHSLASGHALSTGRGAGPRRRVDRLRPRRPGGRPGVRGRLASGHALRRLALRSRGRHRADLRDGRATPA